MTAEPIEIADEPTALYRLFDAAGGLLYVGISRNPVGRWAQHAVEKTWWPQVAKKTIILYGSRREAEVAEGKAIRSESPLHNRAMGRTDPDAPRPPVRKLPPILRKSPDSRKLPPPETFSLEPFIRAHAVRRKCTYDAALASLIFAGLLKDYAERFDDPIEGITALQAEVAAAQKRKAA